MMAQTFQTEYLVILELFEINYKPYSNMELSEKSNTVRETIENHLKLKMADKYRN